MLAPLRDLLTEAGIIAELYETGNFFQAPCLMSALPVDFYTQDGEVFSFTCLFELGEEESPSTVQLLTYALLVRNISAIGEKELYQAVNALNHLTSSGYFVADESKKPDEVQLQYRFIMNVDCGSEIPGNSFFQSYMEMLLAMETGAGMFDAMDQGKSYKDFLENMTGRSFGEGKEQYV